MNSVMTKTFAKYLRLGIIPRIVRGNWKDGDYMYSIYHDNVQYCIDDCGDYEIDSSIDYILESLETRTDIIRTNHRLIKEIYEFLQDVYQTDIWVRVNPGMQLSASFGNSNGEIGVLMMDFVDTDKYDELLKEIKKSIGTDADIKLPEGYVLIVNDLETYEIFDKAPPFSKDVDILFIEEEDDDEDD